MVAESKMDLPGDDDDQVQRRRIGAKNKIIVATPSKAASLFDGKDGGLLNKKDFECFSCIIDKVNLHQAFELDTDLIALSKMKNFPKQNDVYFKQIITSNLVDDTQMEQDEMMESYDKIKTGFLGSSKSLIIQLNKDETQKQLSKFELINHYYAFCKNDTDKYMLLFALKKLSVIEGKLVVQASTIVQAYKIKYFLNRFHMKAFVLSPDMAKQQIQSIVHFFLIGQFDILIMINLEKAYPVELPSLHDVSYVINFDMPESYAMYKEAGQLVAHETGAIISLCMPETESSKILTV